jgi:hypothetical protein
MDTKTNKAAQSIAEFCVSHGISRAMFYKILSQGLGPRVMKIGTRTLISEEAAAAWRRQCEEKAAPREGWQTEANDAPPRRHSD